MGSDPMAGPTGFEPVIFGSTNRRVKPGYTTDPFLVGDALTNCLPRSEREAFYFGELRPQEKFLCR